MTDKHSNNISRDDLLEAKLLAKKGQEAIREAEESGDVVLMTRAELARTFFSEPELSSQHKLNELLLDSLPHPTLIVDKNRRILASNTVAKKIGEVSGDICWSNFGQRDLNSDNNEEHQVHQDAQCDRTKCSFCLADESLDKNEPLKRRVTIGGKNYEVYWSPLEKGQTYLHYAIDLTEREQLESQLRQSHKMEGIGQLAGGVAHDFNNLLAVILAQAELTQEGLGATHPHYSDIVEIQKAATRGAELTRQLLAYSKRQVLKPKTISISECLRDLEKMSKRVIPEDIKLLFGFEGNLDTIEVDPVQFERVLLNLLVNARDAMPDGGELTVYASNVYLKEEDQKRFKNINPGRHVQICVQDSGVGIPPENLDRIFDPFFTTKGNRGTGLGLASAHGTVQQSGGDITVESAVGKGSVFTLVFPSSTNDEDEAPSSKHVPEVYKGEGNLVVIEDMPMLRNVMQRMLTQLGYKVMVFEGAKSTLEFFDGKLEQDLPFEPEEVDLIISDVKMPDMNGPRIIEELGKKRHDIKVLFVSGHSNETHGIDTADYPFLQKPFSRLELSAMLRRLLSAKRRG